MSVKNSFFCLSYSWLTLNYITFYNDVTCPHSHWLRIREKPIYIWPYITWKTEKLTFFIKHHSTLPLTFFNHSRARNACGRCGQQKCSLYVYIHKTLLHTIKWRDTYWYTFKYNTLYDISFYTYRTYSFYSTTITTITTTPTTTIIYVIHISIKNLTSQYLLNRRSA